MTRAIVVIGFWLLAMATSAAASEPDQPGAATTGKADSAAAQAIGAGKVVETMNAGRYTYVRIDLGGEKVWAAAPHFQVEVGDDVILPKGALMVDHYSKTLDRTFDRIYFVSFVALIGKDGEPVVPKGHGDPVGEPSGVEVDFSGIERAEGGKTVGEILDAGADLSGQEVAVRGRVVKFTPNVMGKNWIHLQDGTSGATSGSDLTVTSEGSAEVGNTVLVRGVVSIDRDFGYGYKYDLIIEDASITVE